MKSNTTISIEEDVLNAAREAAKSERRTLSNQIEVWIAEKLGLDAFKSAEQPQPEEVEA